MIALAVTTNVSMAAPDAPDAPLGASTLGDYVWYDADADGIKDPSETGINGVIVNLYIDANQNGVIDAGDTLTQTMTTINEPASIAAGLSDGDDTATGEAGYYDFQITADGMSYIVEIDATNFATTGTLANYIYTGDIAGLAYSGPVPRPVAFAVGQLVVDYNNADFGFVLADLGDLPDGYGTTIQTNNPITGLVEISTTAPSAAVHVITNTLYLGSLVDAESNGQPSVGADGDDTDNNSDGAGTGVGSTDDEDGVVFMGPLMANATVAVSMTANVSTANAYYGAWIDFDGNGSFSASEFYTGTLNNGVTTFNVTAPAVVSDTVYARFRVSANASEVHDLADSTGLAYSGEVEDYVLMSLGNQVWLDDGNGGATSANIDNGILDAGESGIDNVTVQLYQNGQTAGTDTPIATTTTSGGGFYNFTGLTPGDYFVHIPAAEFQASGDLDQHASSSDLTAGIGNDPDTDADDNDDNGVDPGTIAQYDTNGLSTHVVTLAPNTEPGSGVDGTGTNSNYTVDFGIVPLGSIGDTIWGDIDVSGNSTMTVGDLPLQGVVVTLTYPSGAQITATTNVSGMYLFDDLPLGTYTVTVDTSTLPAGYITTPTYDPNGGYDSTSTTTLTVGTPNVLTQDFSYPLAPGINIIKTAGNAADGALYYEIGTNVTVTYTYLISNTGGTYLTNIVITDDMGTPTNTGDDTVLTSASTGCSGLAGPLAPNASTTCTLAVPNISTAVITNTAVTTGNPTDSGGTDLPGVPDPTDNDDALVVINNPSLDLSKTLNTPEAVRTGDPISFTIQVTNTGDITITVLPISDTFNTAYMTYVSATVTQDNITGGVISWTDVTVALGDLAPSGTVSFDVYFTALADTTNITPAELTCTNTGQTCNRAETYSVLADPDGPGGVDPVSVPDDSDQDDVQIINPTSVNLADQSVTTTEEGMMLAWTSVTEVDMVGFNILRQDGSNAPVQINSELIIAENAGQPNGAEYAYLDAGMSDDQQYTYLLEIVMADGRTETSVLDTVGAEQTATSNAGMMIFLPAITR